MEISGAAAIVTGAGSGLGAETARALAKAGAKVAALDLDGAKARSVAEEIKGVGVPCDVASAD
jgi:NAD(P)-dependent dehydrogenase (short-subunit alcohol dehydrogenase family)